LCIEKAKEIGNMLDNEYDAQFYTWQQLALEVGVEGTEKTIQVSCKEEGIVYRIAVQKPLVSKQDAQRRI
jgi:hypothetical protein